MDVFRYSLHASQIVLNLTLLRLNRDRGPRNLGAYNLGSDAMPSAVVHGTLKYSWPNCFSRFPSAALWRRRGCSALCNSRQSKLKFRSNTEPPRNAKSPTGEGWAFLYSGSPTWTRTRDLRINRTGHSPFSFTVSLRFASGFAD